MMTLKTALRHELTDLGALCKHRQDSIEAEQITKALCARLTPACAAEIRAAADDSPLAPLRRQRRRLEVMGYIAIIAFLITVAAFVICYWLVSDNRVPWMTGKLLIAEGIAAVVEIAVMLVCARRITAMQNKIIRREIHTTCNALKALPANIVQRMAGLAFIRPDNITAETSCGCIVCGALFSFDKIGEDGACPACHAGDGIVYDVQDVESFNRLWSLLED